MIKKALIAFSICALSLAAAETFHVTLVEPSVVKGTELQPGEYHLNLNANTVTLVKGKQKVDVPAKIENAEKKFDRTRIFYYNNQGKYTIQEIELGGSKTKLVFDSGVQTGGGE